MKGESRIGGEPAFVVSAVPKCLHRECLTAEPCLQAAEGCRKIEVFPSLLDGLEMKNVALILAFVLLPGVAKAGDGGLRFVRHPAPSPDGSRLAFGYQGDIWTAPLAGGAARRLTVHAAYDSHAVWSPDGRWIAFDSDRFGNGDVFALRVDGGAVRRLTFHSAGDYVHAWSPDARLIYFTSYRPGPSFIRPRVLSAPLDGSALPAPVAGAEMRQPAVSPGGDLIAFVRGGSPWWRKGYRGAAERKIWLCRPETKRYGPLVEAEGNHLWPMWGPDGKSLYFVSDREGTSNLHRLDLNTAETERLTSFTDYGVRFPSISADGTVIAFAAGADVYALKTPDGRPGRIRIDAPLDRRARLRERRTFTRDAAEFALDPGGKELAFAVRGELFALPAPPSKRKDDEPPVETRANLVVSNPAREKDPVFSPDGESLVFASDRNGNYDLFVARAAPGEEDALSRALAFEVEPLATGPEDEIRPAFSPDGTRIAFQRGLGDLVVIGADGSGARTVTSSWNLGDFAWSPDGRWFALSRSDEEYNEEVFLVPADGSAPPVNVSRHPDDDDSPVWFPNGRGLAFVSRRNRDDDDVWMVFLRKADFETPPDALWEIWSGEAEEPEAKDEEEEGEETEDGKEEKEDEVPEVLVDLDGIHRRLKQLTSLPGDERGPAVSPDSLTVAFFADADEDRSVFSVRWDGTGLDHLDRHVSPDGSLRFGPEGKRLWYLDRAGRIRFLDAGGGDSDAVSFRASLTVDHEAERRQMFHEAWRVLDRRFYDPGFHGADWDAARERWAPVALAASCKEDFEDAVEMMLGELNASHLGLSVPGGAENADETGVLGVDFDPTWGGPGLKIASVLRDGPADREESRLAPGDLLLSARGVRLAPGVNLHRVLNHAAGERVRLEVASASDPDATRRVVIRPAGAREARRLRYEAYIRRCRRRVSEAGGGRLAYIHVQSMNWSSFERFERDLYAEAHDKAGLIIDVRNNGGGWTADMLLTVLAVRRHATTRSRGGRPGYPQGRRPFYAWTKPAAVLCNASSFSNAEIFSHAFKTLKRGPLVGRPTFGGVISTGGMRLLDGSWLRLPFRGWWVHPNGPDMELHGAVPDHDVPLTPSDEEAGADPQLDRAVEALLAEIEKPGGEGR